MKELLRERRALVINSILVAFVGLAGGLLYHASQFHAGAPSVGVELQPSVIELVEDALEFDLVKVHLQLKNHFSRSVTVTDIRNSCGCTKVLTSGGVAFEAPMTLDAAESLPLSIEIDTAYRPGQQELSVSIFVDVDEQISRTSSTILMNVRQGWRAVPTELNLTGLQPGELARRKLFITDAFPDPGTGIQCTSVSRSSFKTLCWLRKWFVYQCRIRPQPGFEMASNKDRLKPEVHDGREEVGWTPESQTAHLKNEHSLTVSFRAPAERVEGVWQDHIWLEPDRRTQPALTIPVTWSMQRSPYHIHLKTLTFPSTRPVQKLRRTLMCLVSEESDPNLVVLESPSYVRLEISDVSSRSKRLDLECTVPAVEVPPAEIVLGVRNNSTPVLTVPVRFYREP